MRDFSYGGAWAVRDFANLEIVADARFRLAGKRNHWPMPISLILGNVRDA